MGQLGIPTCQKKVSNTFLILATSLIIFGCQSQEQTQQGEPPPRAVQVIKVRSQPLQQHVTLIGITEPWRQSTLYFEVAGVITTVSVEEGNQVQADDLVAQLELDDYQLAVAKTQSELEVASANLALLEAGTRKEDLEAARADYVAATTRAEFWANELARTERLIRSRSISDAERDRIRQQYDTAVQNRLATKARLDRAVAGPRSEEITASRASAKALRHSLALANRNLAKATLRAPFSGRIEKRLVHPGAYINVFPTGGAPITQLVDLQQIDVVISVPEVMLSRFRAGQSLTVNSATQPQLQKQATVIAVGTVADSKSGTYLVRARLDNSDGNFHGNMVVTTDVPMSVNELGIQLPLDAVGHAYGQQHFVYVVNPNQNRVVSRDIRLGQLVGTAIEITHGLNPGELVIVGAHHLVVPGDRVTVQYAESVSESP